MGTCYEAKIKLAEELIGYDKIKNNEQIKALVDFLEYLFLIQDEELEKKYQDYKKEKGGALKMTVDKVRELYYKQEGREEGREEGILLTKKVLKLSNEGYSISQIAKECNISEDQVKKILE